MSLPQTGERWRCPLCGAGPLYRWVEIRTVMNGGVIEEYRVEVCAADTGADHPLEPACVRAGCGQPHRRCGWVYQAAPQP